MQLCSALQGFTGSYKALLALFRDAVVFYRALAGLATGVEAIH